MSSGSIITEAAFAGFFTKLADAAGGELTREQLADVQNRWWRWCINRPERAVDYAFRLLVARIESAGGHMRFPGIADLKREYDVVVAGIAKQDMEEKARHREEAAGCRYCYGLGIVQVVYFEGETLTIEQYAGRKADGVHVSGGVMSDFSCPCPVGAGKHWMPRFSTGILTHGADAPVSAPKGTRKGWAVKAMALARRLYADGLGHADVAAEVLRQSKA